MSQRMNLLVTVDDNYVRPLRIMLDSFFRYHDGTGVTIYLFYTHVNEANRKILLEQIRKHAARFHAIEIKEDLFAGAPVFRYFPREMYFRLLCGKYIPKEEHRLLYLDPDILIFAPLTELYEANLQNKTIGAIPDYAVEHLMPECMRRLGFKKGERYVNSGVLLIDLDRMREVFDEEKMKAIVAEYGERFSFPDQDLINLYFKNDIRYLSRRYNYSCGYGNARELLRYMLQIRKKVPVIAHYMGESKPWRADYYGKYAGMYYRYLKRYLTEDERKEFRMRYWYKARKFTQALLRLGSEKIYGKHKV